MQLSFDPQDEYVKMVMEVSDEKLIEFFNSMGIDIDLSEEYEDEGLIDEL